MKNIFENEEKRKKVVRDVKSEGGREIERLMDLIKDGRDWIQLLKGRYEY